MLSIEPKILISLLCFVGGMAMIIIGFLSRKNDKTQLYLKRCSEQTKAKIDGFDDLKSVQRRQREYYHSNLYTRTRLNTITYTTPILKFMASDGREYRVTYIRPIEKKLSLDQTVNISYNPENPYEVFIHGDKRMKVSSTMAIETGLILVIAAIAVFVVM